MSLVEVPLGDVADLVRGITFPTSAKKRAAGKGLIPCLRTTNVQDAVEWGDLIYVPLEHIRSEAQRVRAGDILVSMSNSLELVGKCALVTNVPVPATFGAFIAIVRAREGIDPEYIFHALRSPKFKAHIRSVASTTTNISNINSTKLLASNIVLAGDIARKAIVSKLNELFSRIDEGERALEQVSTLVERYRQSVLKAAVTGELTRDWREARKAAGYPVESGEALLTRILTARRETWEAAELAKMKAKGISPKNDTWKKNYKEPLPPNTAVLPDLPAGWVWASFEQLIWQSQNGLSKRRGEVGQPVNVLRLADITDGQIASHDPRKIRLTADEADRYCLLRGDLICVRVNGSRNLTGRLIPVDASDGWAYCDHFIRFRPVPELVPFRYLDLCFDVGFTRGAVESSMVTTAGQNTVSQGSLYQVPVPLPPLEEQQMLLSRIELRLSQAFEQARDVFAARRASMALRQAVLRSAFAGELVPQSSEDEPAEHLLERIAVARTETNPASPKRGRKKKST